MAGTDGNGPKVGDGGRKRNTAANILSKNKVDYTNPGGASALPSLSPAQTSNYYSQLSGLYAGYQQQLSALKLQRVGARADFRAMRAQTRSEMIGGLAGTENANIERGVLGSSADLQQRAGVRGEAAAQIQAGKQAKQMSIASSRLDEGQAGIDYFMGVQNLESQKLAQQQETLAQQLQQNLIVSGQETQMDYLKDIFEALTTSTQGGGGGGGGGGNGTGNGTGNSDWWANLSDAQKQKLVQQYAEQTYGYSSGPQHTFGPHPQ